MKHSHPSLCVCVCSSALSCMLNVKCKCACMVVRVKWCPVTLSVELCVSASHGLGWLGASTETMRDISMHISNHILVSKNKQAAFTQFVMPVFELMCCLSGCYFTGDGAYRTEDGYYQITGRVDDVINVSGHRLGTAEIEDALVQRHTHTHTHTSHIEIPANNGGFHSDYSLDLFLLSFSC